MPLYTLVCYECQKKADVKMSLAEHDDFKKNGIPCPTCGTALVQEVAKLNFGLEGKGWFRDGYSSGDELESELRKYDSLRNRVEGE